MHETAPLSAQAIELFFEAIDLLQSTNNNRMRNIHFANAFRNSELEGFQPVEVDAFDRGSGFHCGPP
ncbi:hypothetical protein BOSE62_130877 [Bosea sp. 62]|nr:hypothetical protein BOSE7B_120909 [Bosea sp. 7B]CAD5272977.1 hypothetical protein BOSE21B_30005 [Bosea sp. 21B]CAD5285169.1 hypothetical protein BOSE46_50243 [Bosea sp. 46]VVT60259.1 hypothetical protein BOS5A_211050 [Bosea sp. EC-HK365B]VXB61343.1 hypothetical protein BOSE62_130877 [Bosea sp. 62]VXC09214.1 hypothetical protein BOSE29B_30005 [Bosea sp. 29B]VXC23302.1 hypothetical protein BOSE127_170548 [Bosea sp. 127]VXC62573.1 hypothetical protein BOSE125_30386 [Bosea sp. 125]